jgi:hypothetical protein
MEKPQRKTKPKPAAQVRAPKPVPVQRQNLNCDVPAPPSGNLTPYGAREQRRAAFDRMVDGRGCWFPIGHPSDSEFHFCCESRDGGSSYCRTHRLICIEPYNRAAN